MYTCSDGKHKRFRPTLDDALSCAKQWSHATNKVISVIVGDKTYTYVFCGREISGRLADQIWKAEAYA